MAVPHGSLPTLNLPHPCSRDNSVANPHGTQDPPRMRFAVLLELARNKLKITLTTVLIFYKIVAFDAVDRNPNLESFLEVPVSHSKKN